MERIWRRGKGEEGEMNKQSIIKILKSGNFTLAYHDNGYCDLYKGRYEYDELPEDENSIAEFEGMEEGYIPAEVLYLIEALGGKVDSV